MNFEGGKNKERVHLRS